MKALYRLLLAAVLVAPAANAVKIPIPIEGATLNLSFQLQTEALVNENGNSAGTDPSYDLYIRRSRLLINGDLSQNFSYLIQFDNPNYGKFGNYTGRAIVQDAWFGWAPTGITGGTVVYVDAGLLLLPISHQLLTSTTNFITADNNTDVFRGLQAGIFGGFRDVGVQFRGWALDKKIGWRGGVYEGARANSTAPNPDRSVDPKSYPRFAGFVNLDLIGSEEGGWLYGAQRWSKDMVLSISGSALYQGLAVRGPNGMTDQRLFSVGAYLDFPQTEAAEFVAEAIGYLSNVGDGARDTGKGFVASAGYRFGFIKPYFSYSQFDSDDCGSVAAGACTSHAADTREIRTGLDFFINKNLNHINVEFGVNHGQSSYGAQSVTPVPLTIATSAAGTAADLSLRKAATKSLLVHWNVNF